MSDTKPLLRSEKDAALPPGQSAHARRRVARPTRSLHLSISLIIFLFIIAYSQRLGSSKHIYKVNGRNLPEKYAICSREGKKIYTVPDAGGVGEVECVVIDKKTVVDTGSIAHVKRKWIEKQEAPSRKWSLVSKKPKIIYLPEGHSLTPGLIDSHGHPLEYGLSRQLQLNGAKSASEAVDRVESFVKAQGRDLPFIEGMGWDQNIWPIKEFPTIDDLETPTLSGRKIALTRVDGHALWISKTLLDSLGDLPDEVEGGQIVRDEKGDPTGVFLDNAMDLIEAVKPPYTQQQLDMALERMMDDALAKGMTTVHDAQLFEQYIDIYKRFASSGKLRMRFYSMLKCDDRESYCGDSVPMIQDMQDGRFSMRSVKLFADGALGSRGAALLEDYSDKPRWKGFLLSPEKVWKPLIKAWYDGGWQVNVHAIGDRANHVVLDAMESALPPHSKADGRFRLEHAQIMTLDDIDKAVRLGVIGSYQPTHATSDMKYAEDRLGSERIKGAYAWRRYLDLGGKIALGSDFPIESIDPLKGFYAAVTRLDENGESPHGPGGWYADQKLTRVEALRGSTTDGALAAFSNTTGSLTPGKRFDAVIWDDDLLNVDQSEMLEVKVKATLVDGRIAFGAIEG